MTIWLTRPQEDSKAMARELSARGINSIVAPVIRIEPHAVTLTEKPDALVLTSRHAVHALPDAWRDLPVYCVGAATAEAVKAKHYSNVIAGDASALELVPLITERKVLYLSGKDIQHDIESLLAARNITVTRVNCYEAAAVTSLTPELRLMLEADAITGVVFFSARTARITDGLMKEEEFTESAPLIDAYCLSLAVAEAAGELSWRSLKVSHRPTREAMLAMIAP